MIIADIAFSRDGRRLAAYRELYQGLDEAHHLERLNDPDPTKRRASALVLDVRKSEQNRSAVDKMLAVETDILTMMMIGTILVRYPETVGYKKILRSNDALPQVLFAILRSSQMSTQGIPVDYVLSLLQHPSPFVTLAALDYLVSVREPVQRSEQILSRIFEATKRDIFSNYGHSPSPVFSNRGAFMNLFYRVRAKLRRYGSDVR